MLRQEKQDIFSTVQQELELRHILSIQGSSPPMRYVSSLLNNYMEKLGRRLNLLGCSEAGMEWS